MSKPDLSEMFAAVSNWGRWGDDDQSGTVNHLKSEHVVQATRLVRTGQRISLAHDVSTLPGPDCPFPAQHHMLASGDALDSSGLPGYEATRDYLGTDIHGLGATHIDALCHMFVSGKMYNGRPAADVTSTGALTNSVIELANGIVGRGVLLDVPLSRSVDFLAPTDRITTSDLDAACKHHGVDVTTGDIVFISTGREARSRSEGARVNPFTGGLAGLDPSCIPWLHQNRIAVLGGDGISDPMPASPVENWPFPVHQIGIVSMGLVLIDNVRLFELADACRAEGRWEFLVNIAPLRIPRGTGSPVNPIAIL